MSKKLTKRKSKVKKSKIKTPSEPLISFKEFFDFILQRDIDLVFPTQARSYELFFITAGLGPKETYDTFYKLFKLY